MTTIATALDLPGIQAAFQAALLHPRGPAGQAGTFLLDGDNQTRARRLAIYQHGYYDRLIECLKADFPILETLMGADLFGFFARAYIDARPSRSPSLYDLSAGFAEFLIATQKAAPEGDDLLLPVDLARLERARLEASRAPGPETLPETPIAMDLLGLGAVTVPDTVLPLALSYPLVDFIEAVSRGDDTASIPGPASSYIATTRRHYKVHVIALEDWQYALLTTLKAGDHATTSVSADQWGRLIAWAPTARLQGLLVAAT